MEVQGKIISVLDLKGGTSKTGKEWKKQEYVMETSEQYPKKICFSVFGEDKIATADIHELDEVKISFDIDSHEFNGRWFTEIKAYKVEKVVNGADPSMPNQTNMSGTPQSHDAYAQAMNVNANANANANNGNYNQGNTVANPNANANTNANGGGDDLPF